MRYFFQLNGFIETLAIFGFGFMGILLRNFSGFMGILLRNFSGFIGYTFEKFLRIYGWYNYDLNGTTPYLRNSSDPPGLKGKGLLEREGFNRAFRVQDRSLNSFLWHMHQRPKCFARYS